MINKICATIDRNHTYNCTSKAIGRQGENICTQLEITLEDCLCDSWVYLHFEKIDGTTKVTERLEIIDNIVTYEIGNDLLDMAGALKVFVELHKDSGLVWKSSTKEYTVLKSFNGVDQIENKEDFITEAQKLLNEVEEGLTPTIGENGNWFILDKDTGKTSIGPKGDKGEKGEAGSVKFIIANELPSENIDESAIYMIPVSDPQEENTYTEYIYVNGSWESLGTSKVEVDLTDYVKNNDYATAEKAGVVKVSSSYGTKVYNGILTIVKASTDDIDGRSVGTRPITPDTLEYAVGSVKASETQSGTIKAWTSNNEDGEVGLNISTEV